MWLSFQCFGDMCMLVELASVCVLMNWLWHDINVGGKMLSICGKFYFYILVVCMITSFSLILLHPVFCTVAVIKPKNTPAFGEKKDHPKVKAL